MNKDDLVYAVGDGKLLTMDNQLDEPGIEWEILFKPFYESISGSYNSSRQIVGKKYYQKIIMRIELPLNSSITIKTRQDDGVWRTIKTIYGNKNNLATFRLPPTRCDKYELWLSGVGPMTILDILREYSFGSEV